jgi:hypothetical protein
VDRTAPLIHEITFRHCAPSNSDRPTGKITAQVRIEDDGSVVFTDSSGQPLSAQWEKIAKQQGEQMIQSLLSQACERNNADIEATLNIHENTPEPTARLRHDYGTSYAPIPNRNP